MGVYPNGLFLVVGGRYIDIKVMAPPFGDTLYDIII